MIYLIPTRNFRGCSSKSLQLILQSLCQIFIKTCFVSSPVFVVKIAIELLLAVSLLSVRLLKVFRSFDSSIFIEHMYSSSAVLRPYAVLVIMNQILGASP